MFASIKIRPIIVVAILVLTVSSGCAKEKPTAREGHCLVYDESRKVFVMLEG